MSIPPINYDGFDQNQGSNKSGEQAVPEAPYSHTFGDNNENVQNAPSSIPDAIPSPSSENPDGVAAVNSQVVPNTDANTPSAPHTDNVLNPQSAFSTPPLASQGPGNSVPPAQSSAQTQSNQYGQPYQHGAGHNFGAVNSQSTQYSTQYNQYGQYGEANPNASAFASGYRTVIPMRPLGIGDTIDAAIRLLKFNPVPFIVFPLIVSAVFYVISIVVSAVAGETAFLATESLFNFDQITGPNPSSLENLSTIGLGLMSVTAIITFIFSIFQYAIISIAGTRVTIASIRGYKLSLHDTFQIVRPRFGKLLLRMLGLTALIIGIVFLVMLIPLIVSMILLASMLAANGNVGGGAVFIFFLLFLALLFALATIYVRLVVSFSALIAEDCGVFTALKRGWNLTRGSFWHIFTLMVFSFFFAMIVFTVISFFFGLLTLMLTGGSQNLALITLVVTALGTLVGEIFVYPFFSALINTIYVNMRFKRENFHQQLLYEASQQASKGSSNGAGPNSQQNYNPAQGYRQS